MSVPLPCLAHLSPKLLGEKKKEQMAVQLFVCSFVLHESLPQKEHDPSRLAGDNYRHSNAHSLSPVRAMGHGLARHNEQKRERQLNNENDSKARDAETCFHSSSHQHFSSKQELVTAATADALRHSPVVCQKKNN